MSRLVCGTELVYHLGIVDVPGFPPGFHQHLIIPVPRERRGQDGVKSPHSV
jgi:hypothetical protein